MRKRPASLSASEVAQRAGVSESAVSRAFTPGASISRRTRDQVLKAAQALGYRPNLLARSLIKGRSGLVGVVIGNPHNPSCITAFQALSKLLSEAGKHILIFAADDAESPADVQVRDLLQFRIDALVLMSASITSQVVEQCVSSGIPVISCVRVSRSFKGMVSVTGDNIGGSRIVADHLAQRGYRRLAYLASFRNSPTSSERESTFSDRVESLGLKRPQIISGHFERERAKAAVRDVLSRSKRPDAIYCANDYLALATIEVARYEFGLEIGPELGVVGFDDIDQAAWPFFSLTTFSQPSTPMVTEVVRLLLKDGKSDLPSRIVVPGTLICRKSTEKK